MVIAATVAGTTAHISAQNKNPAASHFTDGIRAYENRNALSARSAFHRAATAESRAPDAWANYGTASWAAGDTAGAVVGWQRALRLEPGADDLRPRLSLVAGAASSRHAYVPPVPPAPLQLLALGAWVVAALALAFSLVRRRPLASPLTMTALSVVLLSGGAAAWVHDRTDASDLAVIAESRNTRAAPALGAEPGISTVAGEIVRITRREGVWSRVTMERGTGGWMESGNLLPLHD